MKLFLILLAAGEGKRLNARIPKAYVNINGKNLLEYNINAFKSFKEIKKTIVVYNKKHKKRLDKIKLNKNCIKILGGNNRQKSVYNALKKIKNMKCDKVLIHDVARANIDKDLIKRIIYKLKKKDIVIPLININDAIKITDKNLIISSLNKNYLKLTQTPQGFNFKKLITKHKNKSKESFDDDSSLFNPKSDEIFSINGNKNNYKITEQQDLEIFRKDKSKNISYGIGFDVHRLVPKKKLYIGGLKIKSNLGTLGHSDGDPLLHAIIDALLGACKMGDIGQKFSDKDKKFKNIRSTILLKKVINEIKFKNYYINNLDINIITQTPKVQKYKNKMMVIISKLCEISKTQVNIKGKTTEKLGLIGKKKAIACEVIASVIKND
ncbi:MAG: 2-C-methyl-D-erythritol 2,4-cyclodiphosphate synthase [Candidatus Pelagibacter sp. TMED64]|nr:2-C-methyl-D-erythritol 2,4-cyclodiphosphate synthase [Candidatus Pelagibacter sp.]OUU67448.1 MAG: 2-C-methyl-D-erythritol 2,4-cyclodiphosphate synthase [Candidatus Pelagibacter sp. TMED64]